MNVLRLRFELRINKLKQGLNCHFRKLNRAFTKKIRAKNVNTEELKGL
jgi:hypothetical protein